MAAMPLCIDARAEQKLLASLNLTSCRSGWEKKAGARYSMEHLCSLLHPEVVVFIQQYGTTNGIFDQQPFGRSSHTILHNIFSAMGEGCALASRARMQRTS
jgi:hypothetical protein